jgi:hypothetical protein
MAFLAETLVDEWLNRQGYFTVRGIKDGMSYELMDPSGPDLHDLLRRPL